MQVKEEQDRNTEMEDPMTTEQMAGIIDINEVTVIARYMLIVDEPDTFLVKIDSIFLDDSVGMKKEKGVARLWLG